MAMGIYFFSLGIFAAAVAVSRTVEPSWLYQGAGLLAVALLYVIGHGIERRRSERSEQAAWERGVKFGRRHLS